MAKSTNKSTMGDYKCLVSVRHDGTIYEPGSTIDLNEDQAKALLAVKAVELINIKPTTKADEK